MTLHARVYACIFPEDALLRDSVAKKLAERRFLADVELPVTDNGNIVFDSTPYQALLREDEEFVVEIE